ncbi:hypothetical protein FACS1894186_5900 [Alphaproteobacteria bacterium]|nr:hypothetical protein FACS1894186_5900 [Alphaproteobacteria bacterium]
MSNWECPICGKINSDAPGQREHPDWCKCGAMGALTEVNPPIAAIKAELKYLMNSLAYWRDHDPEIVARVEAGFRKLYPKL